MYIVIDIGGTFIRLARASSSRKDSLDLRHVHIFQTPRTYERMIAILHTEVRAFGGSKIRGIGVCIKGVVDRNQGTVTRVTQSGKQVLLIASDIRNFFHCPVIVENDATAAAIGEAEFGKVGRDFLFVIWGTGIGGTQIYQHGKKLFVSSFEPGGQLLLYGNHRSHLTFGQICSGKGIVRRFKRPAEQLNASQWSAILSDMAIGISNLLTIRPSATVIFGGGVALHHPELIRRLHRMLKQDIRLLPKCAPPRTMQLAATKDMAGLSGAFVCLTMSKKILFL